MQATALILNYHLLFLFANLTTFFGNKLEGLL